MTAKKRFFSEEKNQKPFFNLERAWEAATNEAQN
jgi:hypothetical protein